jgi:hypothetical protein
MEHLALSFRKSLVNLKVDTDYYYLVNVLNSPNRFYFHIKVFVQNNKINNYSIHINGVKQHCMDLSIDGDPLDPRFSVFMEPNVAKFIKIRYDKDCNTDANLSRAEGTNMLLKTGLYLVKVFFPNVVKFRFEDYSARDCSQKSKYNVMSSKYYIALFGSTWYEGLYNAKLEDLKQRFQYTTYLERLYDTSLKSNISFDQLRALLKPNMNEIELNDFNKLEQLYNKTSNFYDFFQKIKVAFNYNNKNLEDREKLCDLLEPWIHEFIDRIIFDNTNIILSKWIIDIEDIIPIDIDIILLTKPPIYQLGGKKYLYIFYNGTSIR